MILTLLGLMAAAAPDPFDKLSIYPGEWTVRAAKPWSGAAPGAVDRLTSRCQPFTAYYACEQTVNGKPLMLIVYTASGTPGRLNTRMLSPAGLAGGRGEVTMDGNRWTYLDKPPAGLEGPWSRTENVFVDRDHIRFEEFESTDQGKTWKQTNSGTEERVKG